MPITSTTEAASVAAAAPDRRVRTGEDGARRTIGRARLGGRSTKVAIALAAVAAAAQALGAVLIGRLAERPGWVDVGLLALGLMGAAVLDTVGRVIWSGVVDRAEGELRTDLLDSVMRQPVAALSEQAVGEILDRIDDDTHELGTLLRMSAWRVIRLVLVAVPLLLVAGFTWWPAWVLLPVTACSVFVVVRPLLGLLALRKVAEEAAWTDHAAAMEEGIAARDDLRTSLGQPYLIRRCAELASVVHARMDDVVTIEATIMRRSGLLLHGLLAIVAVAGVVLVAGGFHSTAMLVTLFAVTVTFVGQVDQVAHHLPDLQAGVGALVRLRALMSSADEPTGGRPVPHGPASIEFRDLYFAYPQGSVRARRRLDGRSGGDDLALVGRSGSGKSTLASLLVRAVDPAPGTVFLAGVDVLDLELDDLRATVGLVSQRTEIIAGTLAENIAMFSAVERADIEAAIDELGLRAWVAGLPAGLDTLLGPSGTVLSAGEQQLVAFARLIVRDVRVIVLDEATARMDPMTEAQVVAASQRLLRGTDRHPDRSSTRDHRARRRRRRDRGRSSHPARAASADSRSKSGRFGSSSPTPTTTRWHPTANDRRRRSAEPVDTVSHHRRSTSISRRASRAASCEQSGSIPGGAWPRSGSSRSRSCSARTVRSRDGSGGTWSSVSTRVTARRSSSPVSSPGSSSRRLPSRVRFGDTPTGGSRSCCGPGRRFSSARPTSVDCRRPRPAKSSHARWTAIATRGMSIGGSTSRSGWWSSSSRRCSAGRCSPVPCCCR